MTIKTAISIEESLYRQLEKLAEEMETSRSQVFSIALRSFLRQRENRQLLEDLDAAYGAPPTASERRLQKAWRKRHRLGVAGEW
ncbi:MAG: ribbon-helix-helix protein, CopG family [Vicinamibacteria bacterium]